MIFSNMPTRARQGWLAWGGAFAIAALALVLTNFNSQDPDSQTYARISARMAGQPLHTWIAPYWDGYRGWELFREHPVGVFLVPALLGKLGLPPVPAAYVAGVGFSMLLILLLQRVAALIAGDRAAVIVPWVALILPVAFINRIRATQEYPVFACILLALYALEKSRTSAPWIAVFVLATCGAALIKGVFVVFVPILAVLWLLCIRADEHAHNHAALALVLSVGAVAIGALGYEGLYRHVTGESFLAYYLPYRFGQVAPADQSMAGMIVNKLGNIPWYSVRLLWFGFPGTLALLMAGATRTRFRTAASRREVQGLAFALAAAAAYVGVMSLGATRSERFILPAYFSLGIAGTLVAVHRWDGVARLNDRLARLQPYMLPGAWLFLVLVALPFEMNVPYVKFR